MDMKRLWLLLSLVALLVPGGFAAAVELPVLGLNQMIQMALEKSPEMKEADQDIVAAQKRVNGRNLMCLPWAAQPRMPTSQRS